MKSKYQNYYDKLNGKDFKSPLTGYKSQLEESNSKIGDVATLINSSTWVEKGLEIIKNSVLPSIEKQKTQVSEGLNALSQAVSKIDGLLGKLGELDALEKKLDSLGGTWSTSSGKTEEEVNRHNGEINRLNNDITVKEGEIDSIVSEINSISFNFSSQASTFSGYMNSLVEATKTPESGVLDFKPGVLTDAGRNARLLGKAAVILDFTCDGQHMGQDGEIVIKKGETVHLKVRIPDDVEGVEQMIRTSPGGYKGWSNMFVQEVTPRADKKNSATWFNGREYDWYITGKETTGNDYLTLSQTALFKAPNTAAAKKQGSYKGMARLKVKVVA